MKHTNRDVHTADVVVIGAGPGGSAAAKNCAQRGLRTLLLEKAKPPRYKSCLRRFPDNMTRTLVAREFGPTPDWVLTDPPHIYYLARGMKPTEYGHEPQEEPQLCPHMFSTECDYWMNLKAKSAGAELWDETLVTDVIQEGDGVIVKISRRGENQEIHAGFVVGADGAMSTIRRRLYPDLKFHTLASIQEFYPAALSPLDRKYAYTFEFDAPQKDMFHIVHKKGCFHIDVDASARSVKESADLAKQTMYKMFGFNPETKPMWSAGTTMVLLLDEVLSGRLIPAKGNVLLVGNAAGLVKPSDVGRVGNAKIWFGGGGVGLAVKSGIMAAEAISKAIDTSKDAAGIYLPDFENIVSVLKDIAANKVYYKQGNWKDHDKFLNKLI
ncbi:MAG: NAD(P)/FAD-dependent oxidoreductase [Dehalococcoidales bacterium]|nr:NAD(P)/FAD-dependent oxidoreductase [Dehalococcoidales bacterium]